jgi:hypothetical protein
MSGGNLKAGLISGLTGGFGFGLSKGLSYALTEKAAALIGSAIAGGAATAAQGGKFGKGVLGSLIGAVQNAIISPIVHGVADAIKEASAARTQVAPAGVSQEASETNANGAATAAMARAFNDEHVTNSTGDVDEDGRRIYGVTEDGHRIYGYFRGKPVFTSETDSELEKLGLARVLDNDIGGWIAVPKKEALDILLYESGRRAFTATAADGGCVAMCMAKDLILMKSAEMQAESALRSTKSAGEYVLETAKKSDATGKLAGWVLRETSGGLLKLVGPAGLVYDVSTALDTMEHCANMCIATGRISKP